MYTFVLLQSLADNAPGERITIYWQDIDSDVMEALSACYPDVSFLETSFYISGSYTQKIPAKMHLWTKAVNEYTENLCFVDSDAIVAKSPAIFLETYKEDIIFTDKKEQFHINTGVMLVRPSNMVRNFFMLWTAEIMNIITDSELLDRAISTKNHYGAADQMAFYELIGYQPDKQKYILPSDFGTISLRSVPCDILNQTNSVPLDDGIFVYHYKGAWRDILRKNTFTPARTRSDSLPMLLQFIHYHRLSIAKIKKLGATSKTQDKLKIYRFSRLGLSLELAAQRLKAVLKSSIGAAKVW
jgi:hypothetical protein